SLRIKQGVPLYKKHNHLKNHTRSSRHALSDAAIYFLPKPNGVLYIERFFAPSPKYPLLQTCGIHLLKPLLSSHSTPSVSYCPILVFRGEHDNAATSLLCQLNIYSTPAE